MLRTTFVHFPLDGPKSPTSSNETTISAIRVHIGTRSRPSHAAPKIRTVHCNGRARFDNCNYRQRKHLWNNAILWCKRHGIVMITHDDELNSFAFWLCIIWLILIITFQCLLIPSFCRPLKTTVCMCVCVFAFSFCFSWPGDLTIGNMAMESNVYTKWNFRVYEMKFVFGSASKKRSG